MTTPEPPGPPEPDRPVYPYGHTPPPRSAPAGWYPNPQHGYMQWWDGYAWGQLAPATPQYVQPVIVPAAKSTAVSYLLLIFLGGFAAHRFYLGRIGSAIAFLAIWWIGWLTTEFAVGFFLVGAGFIWMIVDLFLIPSIVRERNSRILVMPPRPQLPPPPPPARY